NMMLGNEEQTNEHTEGKNMELKPEEELRRELIQVQIESIRKESTRGWLWHLGPTLGAIAASIAASIIVILLGSQIVKGYFDSKVTVSQQKSAELEHRISDLQVQTDKESETLKKLEHNIQVAKIELSARNDHNHLVNTDELGLGVVIKDQGTHYVLSIGTHPQGATISVFAMCKGNYVFPNEHPNPKDCQLLYEPQCSAKNDPTCGSKSCKTSKNPCIYDLGKVGSGMDRSLWISAELNGVKTVKYIYVDK
ncbi:MAG: hypothetical protein WA610_09380, partial [Thermodesulfovibrionales bacterium]